MTTVQRSRATVKMRSESRDNYLSRAARYAAYRFAIHRESLDYCFAHPSHPAGQALRDAQLRFVDLGTFGAEGYTSEYTNDFDGDDLSFQYLNTGDTYESTVCYMDGRFFVGAWGDIVENHK
jgi:hypothetical protein